MKKNIIMLVMFCILFSASLAEARQERNTSPEQTVISLGMCNLPTLLKNVEAYLKTKGINTTPGNYWITERYGLEKWEGDFTVELYWDGRIIYHKTCTFCDHDHKIIGNWGELIK